MSDTIALDANELEWRDTPHDGVQWKKLRFDPESGESAVLLRFAPGSEYGAHRHPKGEQYFVLEGSLDDGASTYGPGRYVYYPPGSAHRPCSAEGWLLFVTLPAPIEEL